MPDSPDSGGIGAPLTQQIDFDTATFVRKRVPLLDRLMTKEQAQAYQSGAIPAPAQTPEDYGSQPAAQPYVAPLEPPPPAYQAAIPVPAAPPPAGAPTRDVYPDRVNDRIGKIWGQKREAEEKAAALEARLVEVSQRLDLLMTGRSAPTQEPPPYTNQYSSYSPSTPAPQSAPPAGDYVSRAEMQALLAHSQQVAIAQQQLANSQNAARAEAERDFPEVFAHPQLNAQAADIWLRDRGLQNDPQGPWKVAAMVRGLSVGLAPSGPAPGSVADMRKTALAGVGFSVPEGSGGPTQDQAYHQARQRAIQTGDRSDWARVFALARP